MNLKTVDQRSMLKLNTNVFIPWVCFRRGGGGGWGRGRITWEVFLSIKTAKLN